ncbi:MAG: glycoside hydrolase family 97 catalytic domain-containing protein [Oscillospiraceae bacterium]|nr:glycoside hydrolase family 97 catalytic domain-containing protein [Oscillospiraceae bacterium]
MKKVLSFFLTLSMLIAAAPAGLVYAEPGYLSLEKITPESVSVGWGGSIKINEGYASDSGDWRPLRLMEPDGEYNTYAEGVCGHAAADVYYNIEGFGATKLEFFYGVNYQEGNNNGSCRFYVYADGEELLKDSTVYRPNQVRGTASITIPAGAKKLRLRADDGGNGINNDHAVWAEPKLYVSDRDLLLMSLSAGKTLPVGETTTVTSSFSDLYGNKADAENVSYSYSSSDEDIATVAEDGVVMGVSAGTVTITCNAIADGQAVSGKMDISVISLAKSWSVVSPNGQSEARVMLTGQGEILYYIVQDGRKIVDISPIGMKTNQGDFSTGLSYSGESSGLIDETYSMVAGKAAEYANKANEMTLSFTKESDSSNMRFDVIFRAYDDGAAYSYNISRVNGSSVNISFTDETSAFIVPAGSTLIAASDDTNCHEDKYFMNSVGTVSGRRTMPALFETPSGDWGLISEARLDGTYTGSMLHISGTTLKLAFPKQQTSSPTSGAVVLWKSPWRFVVTGTLKNLIENTMAENLSPAPDDRDWSWVVPGVAAWTWEVGLWPMQSDPEAIKKYIDLSAEMGWKYFIMDDGWQSDPSAANPDIPAWLDDVVAYGRAKGVGLLAWVNCANMDTAAKREARLPVWKSHGIVGIKIDFFDREDQSRMQLYNSIYEACADLEMIVNCHGANKPTGESRTWPNVIQREAVRGEEQNSNLRDQNTMLPFVRGSVGPSDYTPRIYPVDGSNITTVQQLALNVLLQGGLPVMADSAENYRRSPAYTFLKNMPATWDESLYLGGKPGEFVSIARRSGESWYAAAATDAAREVVFPLGFLEDGVTYRAEVYRDGASKNDMIVDVLDVVKDDSITVNMPVGGGCALKIVRPVVFDYIKLPQSATVEQFKSYQLMPETAPAGYDVRDLVWNSSNPDVATVSDSGFVKAVAPGKAVITAASAVNPAVQADCSITVTLKLGLISEDSWEVLRETDKLTLDSETAISIFSELGDIGERDTANNLWMRSPDDADFDISVKITANAPRQNYQSWGIFARLADNPNATVTVMRRYHGSLQVNGSPNIFQLHVYNNGYTEKQTQDVSPDNSVCYLRLVKSGTSFTGYYRYSPADEWTRISTSSTHSAFTGKGAGDIKIGVVATNTNSQSDNNYATTVTIENFMYNETVIPFAANQTDYILSVDDLVDIAVTAGTAFGDINLPTSVKAELASGGEAVYAVNWNDEGYNASVNGTYPIEGTLVTNGLTCDVKAKINIVVTSAQQSVVTVTPPAAAVYGLPVGDPSAVASAGGSAFTFTYSGVPYDGSALLLNSAAKPVKAGEYTVTAALISDTHIGVGTADFTIARKPITVTVDDKTRLVGEPNPAFTLSFDSVDLVGNDAVSDLAVTFSCAANAASSAGIYPITGESASANYDVAIVPGHLTVSLVITNTITVAAGVGGSASGGGSFLPGSEVTLTAVPSSGYSFDGWHVGGAQVSQQPIYSFVAENDANFEARFALTLAAGQNYFHMGEDFSRTTSDGPIWKYQSVTTFGTDYTPYPNISSNGYWREYADNGSWNLGVVGPEGIHPGSGVICGAVTFVAPRTGEICISSDGPIRVGDSPNGVLIITLKNESQIWPKDGGTLSNGWKQVPRNSSTLEYGQVRTHVNTGDRLCFIVNNNGDMTNAFTYWTPVIEYYNPAERDYFSMADDFTIETSGGDVWKYQYYDTVSGTYHNMPIYDGSVMSDSQWLRDGYEYGTVRAKGLHPGSNPAYYAAITFVAPKDGDINILPGGTIYTDGPNGAFLRVVKDGQLIWPDANENDGWKTLPGNGRLDAETLSLHVNKGERLHFLVKMRNGINGAYTYWNPTIKYVDSNSSGASYYNMRDGFSIATSDGSVWKYGYVTHNQNDYHQMPNLAPDNTWRQLAHSDTWDLGVVGAAFSHPAVSGGWDTVTTFVAPKDGFIKVSSSVPIRLATNQGDGIEIKIDKNDDKIWPKGSMWKYIPQVGAYHFEPLGLAVKAGDKLRFVSNKHDGGAFDSFYWNPVVEYVDFAIGDYALTMYPESTYKLVAFGGSGNIEWTASDTSKAVVDGDGVVTARALGSAVITATDSLNNTAVCLIHVIKPEIDAYPLTYGMTNDGKLRVSFSAANNSSSGLDCKPAFILEMCDGDGRVVETRTADSTVVAAGASGLIYADFSNPDNAQNPIVKLYFKDDYAEKVPLQTLDLGVWRDYVSAIPNSTGSSVLSMFDNPTYTFRSYVKPVKDFGRQEWRFLFSNYRDFTGGIELGSQFTIREAFIADGGANPDGSIVSGTAVRVKYDGSDSKVALPGERFWSDAVDFNLPEGHYLCFSWTLEPVDPPMAQVPLCHSTLARSFSRTNGDYASQIGNGGFRNDGSWGVFPNMYAVRKTVGKRISFIGDSITQGVGTNDGREEFWVAQIAQGFQKSPATSDIAVYNVGISGATAFDAARDGAWLGRIKQDDEVTLVLGVNDLNAHSRPAADVIANVRKMVASVRLANPKAIITLFTIPPFDYSSGGLTNWLQLNSFIAGKPEGVDYVFDMADVLEDPNRPGCLKPAYYPSPGDAHPNALGCAAVAEAYLAWYANRDIPVGVKDYYDMADDFSVRTSDGPIWKYQYVTHGGDNYQPLPVLAPADPNGSLSATWRQDGNTGSWGMGYVGAGALHPATTNNWDTAVTFVAPKAGFIRISASGPIVFDKHSVSGGVNLKVDKNNVTIWPKGYDWKKYVSISETDVGGVIFKPMGLRVEAGDRLHFVVNMAGNGVQDNLRWNPIVEYVDFGISDYAVDMYKGLEYRITASHDEVVMWSSSDESVVAVDASGVVTAKALGAAVITAVSDERSAAAVITVANPRAYVSPISFGKASDGKTRVSVSVTNSMDVDYTPTAIFAVYDGSGRLVASRLTSDAIVGAGGEGVLYADFDVAGIDSPTVKQFMWDIDNIPVAAPQEADLGVWAAYGSAVPNSTGNNVLEDFGGHLTRTYKVYVKPTKDFGPQTWRFWFSNIQDTTRSGYPLSEANRLGGYWTVDAAYIADGGANPDGTFVAGTLKQITYGGATTKKVASGEQFWTDDVEFDLPEGHYLCFIWSITRASANDLVPRGEESITYSYYRDGDYASQQSVSGFAYSGRACAAPNLFAVKKNISKRMAFIGDSITQGVGTSDGLDEYWVANIMRAFAASDTTKDIAVWNNGLGWARAYDGSTCGAWLSKVKSADEITLCLGVNDIGVNRSAEDIIDDIKKMVSSIRTANPKAIVTLFTVPTWQFTGESGDKWRSVNGFVRSKPDNVDYVFDIAGVLSRPAPDEHLIIPEYMGPGGDYHPGTAGCRAIADAYLNWYASRG